MLACITPVRSAAGKPITTIEGLARGGASHPVQQAFVEEGAMQCGYCTPGMVRREEILFENGRVANARFSQYRVTRFRDLPEKLEVVLLDRKDLPSAGAGETPILAVAPAMASAVFDATGARPRTLPLRW